MNKIDHNITPEQQEAGIDVDYLYWFFWNKYKGNMPEVFSSEHNGVTELHVVIPDEIDKKEVKNHLKGLAEREENKKVSRTYVVESLNIFGRWDAIKAYCKTRKNLTVKYSPVSDGHKEHPTTYINYQRYYFNRSLIEEENKAIQEIMRQDLKFIET